jgi:hypothetical protein
LNHEVTKDTKEGELQRREGNLHRNNAAEWILIILLYPAWLCAAAWNEVPRFVLFVTSWFN